MIMSDLKGYATEYGKSRIIDKIKELFVKGAYTKDSQTVIKPVFRIESTGDTFYVYLYLDDNDTGTFTNFMFLDEYDKPIIQRDEVVTKDEQKGLLIAFAFKLKEIIDDATS
jgi:hypothetical protein